MRLARRLSLLVLFAATVPAQAQSPPQGTVNLPGILDQEYGIPGHDKSVDDNPLSIGGRKFEHGLGTQANSSLQLPLNGSGERLTALVGVDDEVGKRGSVVFKVEGDEGTVWESGVMHGGDSPKPVDVDLHGIRSLILSVESAGTDIQSDHADWAELRIQMSESAPVQRAAFVPPETPVFLTPKAPPQPRINGPRVFGVRPGSPFLFTIAATGDRPMTFAAEGLPKELVLDATTGRITGVLKKPGEYRVTLRAQNALGRAERTFKIIAGPTIGLTPALGWNSWNCFGSAVTAQKVRAAADAMVKSGLIDHGWSYINIDDYWEVHRNSKDPTLQGPQRDAKGRVLSNPRFPDMKALADYVHDRGLRIGIYSSPGPWTCGGCVGSWQHQEEDARQYADWGFDYLKYDWCTYADVAGEQGLNYSRETLSKPFRKMHGELQKLPRDILFSICEYGMGKSWEWGADTGGNSWRTTGDIVDTWPSVSRIGFQQAGREKYSGPGHFNDEDMLAIGYVAWGPQLHPTRLTPNEQYAHVSLWCLLDSPLLIGCDLTQLDDFTLSLLTNDEVLEVDQDPLGRQARRVSQHGPLEVWAKEMEDGSKAVGLFNRGGTNTVVTAKWSDLELFGKQRVRDLWRQADLGTYESQFEASVPRHGVVLVKLSSAISKTDDGNPSP
ncbi:MAG TPA: NPCBM/NEW2 domain-containing protein [Candidatus Limnocylindrales bacterium]|nr:NPCBM/NEW2 domain-containing protein [Candidatus Limnocylindrales bacterium]